MTASDIVTAVKAIVPRGTEVYCDHRADIVQDMFRAGINAKLASKGADSIDYGVKTRQNFELFIHPDSHNLIKELRYYKYKEDKDGNAIGGAYADVLNHAIDAARYGTVGLCGFTKKFRSFEPVMTPKFLPN
jgi:phage terminase large subunit